MLKIEGEHYVLVAQQDVPIDSKPEWIERKQGPIVFETILGEQSTLKSAQLRQIMIGKTYGHTRIARLVFEDHLEDKQL